MGLLLQFVLVKPIPIVAVVRVVVVVVVAFVVLALIGDCGGCCCRRRRRCYCCYGGWHRRWQRCCCGKGNTCGVDRMVQMQVHGACAVQVRRRTHPMAWTCKVGRRKEGAKD